MAPTYTVTRLVLSERRRGSQEQQCEEHEHIAGNEVAAKKLSPGGLGSRAPRGDWMDARGQRATDEDFKCRAWTIKRRRHGFPGLAKSPPVPHD